MELAPRRIKAAGVLSFGSGDIGACGFPFITLEGYEDQPFIFRDAGGILNAPGEFACLEAREGHSDLRQVVLVTIDTHTLLNVPDQTTTHGGLMQWFIPLVKLAIIGEADVSRYTLKVQAAFEDSAVDVNAFGLVAQVEDGVGVYNTDEHTVSAILAAGQRFVAENSDVIDALEGESQ